MPYRFSTLMISAVLAFGAGAPIAAYAQRVTMDTPAAPALNKGDQKIVADLARANLAEIAAGKLAVARAQSPQVKAYAQQMIDDHTRALGDVTALAQENGVSLPSEPDARHKAMVKALGKLSGAKFDKAYMTQAGVKDHTAVHKALTKQREQARDQDVKALVAKLLPTVEQHLHQANEVGAAAK